MSDKLSVARLRELMDYDPVSGRLTWRHRAPESFPGNAVCGRDGECAAWNRRYAGKEAFATARTNGYRYGTVLRVCVKAHRAAWAIIHGYWPVELDHINGDRSDNRLCNLREVDRATNSRNRGRRSDNSSGATGVRIIGGRWKARIHDNGRERHLGTFDTREAALAAWRSAADSLGYHSNHGRA